MINVRHRRPMRVYRVLAYVIPVLTVALWLAAGSWAGTWVVLAAVGSVVSYGMLAALVAWLDVRRWKDVAATRKTLYAQHQAELRRRAVEQQAFAAHMLGLVNLATEKFMMQRHVSAVLRAEVADLRAATTVSEETAPELPDLVGAPEPSGEPPNEVLSETPVDQVRAA